MFGLRYHVASLAAVFVALALGILLGVAVSGKVTDVGEDAELQYLRDDNEQLEQEREAAQAQAEAATAEGEGAEELLARAYPTLMDGRLEGENGAADRACFASERKHRSIVRRVRRVIQQAYTALGADGISDRGNHLEAPALADVGNALNQGHTRL